MANPLRANSPANTAPLRAVRLGAADAVVGRAADGTIHIRASQPLGNYHNTLSEPLERWAREAPERVFLAQRNTDDQWCKLSYAEVLGKANISLRRCHVRLVPILLQKSFCTVDRNFSEP